MHRPGRSRARASCRRARRDRPLRPGSLERYLHAEVSAGRWGERPPFDYRVAGGTVARLQDLAGLRTPADLALVSNGVPPWPCGACRQALSEFGADLVVLVEGPEGVVRSTLAELLPRARR